jgi:iron complex outermembrane receptor protein
VISGPGGTLWGANAVNGVINIISKSAKDTQGGYAEFGGGNELQGFASARYGGTLAPNIYYRVYGKYFEHDNSVFSNGAEASNEWDMSRGGFRLDSLATPDTTLTLQGDLYGVGKTSGGNLLGRWSRTLGGDSAVSLQLYYDRTHLVNPVAASAFAPAGALTDDLDTYDLDFQHRFHISDQQEFIWGLGYRFTHDVVNNAAGLAFLPPVLDHNLYSAFVQDEFKLAKALTLTLGAKLEHNDYTGLETEPNVRLQWAPASDQMVWAAVSRAVRTPSRVDRDLHQPRPPPAILTGNPEFKSETVIAYELGYRAQLGAKTSGSLSLFYNEYDDVRSLSFTPATILPLFFENNLEGETHGLELSVHYLVAEWWRLQGGYDLLRENIRVKSGRTDINHALNETADPHHQFSLRSAMDLPGGVQLDLAFRQVDSFPINNGGVVATVAGYHELDAQLAWQITPEVELALVGRNLLHAHHAEYGAPSPAREEVQRSLYAKLRWRF